MSENNRAPAPVSKPAQAVGFETVALATIEAVADEAHRTQKTRLSVSLSLSPSLPPSLSLSLSLSLSIPPSLPPSLSLPLSLVKGLVVDGVSGIGVMSLGGLQVP